MYTNESATASYLHVFNGKLQRTLKVVKKGEAV